jgi:hypothetical protein
MVGRSLQHSRAAVEIQPNKQAKKRARKVCRKKEPENSSCGLLCLLPHKVHLQTQTNKKKKNTGGTFLFGLLITQKELGN